MMRSSLYVRMLTDAMLNHAVVGEAISPVVTVDICRLLEIVAADCELMENRLAGRAPVNLGRDFGNVISFVARAHGHSPDKPEDRS